MESLKCFLVALAIIVVVVLAFAPAADAQEPIPTIPIDEPWTPVPPTAEPSHESLGPGSLNFWACGESLSVTYGGEAFAVTVSGEQIESPEYPAGTEIAVFSGGYTVTLLIWGDRLHMEPDWFGGDTAAAWCARPEAMPTATAPASILLPLDMPAVSAGEAEGLDVRQSLAGQAPICTPTPTPTGTPTPTPLRPTGFAGPGTIQSPAGQVTTSTPSPQSTAVGARMQNHFASALAFWLWGAPYAWLFWAVLGFFLLAGLAGLWVRQRYAQKPGGS